MERRAAYWDKQAGRYDREMDRWDRRLFGDSRPWVCGRAVGDVLEVAVGTGRNLPFYPDGVRFTGVDWSPAMLGIARERAAALGREADLRPGDAQALDFPDGSFDTVLCALGLCAIPDDRLAVTEMARVLRPGGRLLLVDHVAAPARALRAAQWLYERISIPFGRRALPSQAAHPRTGTWFPDRGDAAAQARRRRARLRAQGEVSPAKISSARKRDTKGA